MHTHYPIEILAPDIAPYRQGNTGIDFVHQFDSGLPGPHVMVSALVHGNELCGAVALDFLLREAVRPAKGRLSLVFANVAAYARFDPADPDASRFVDEDFNRVWDPATLDGPRQSIELTRARELRGLLDSVDFLLDLHSMQHPTPPLALSGPTRKGRQWAVAIGYPAYVVADAGHAAGRRMRDHGGFSDASSTKNALLVECGQHWAASSAEVAREMVLRVLDQLGLLSPELRTRHQVGSAPAGQRVIEVTQAVTIQTDAFRFAGDYVGMEVLPHEGDLIATDGALEIRAPYADCVLIMPSRRLTPGSTAVRLGRFLAD